MPLKGRDAIAVAHEAADAATRILRNAILDNPTRKAAAAARAEAEIEKARDALGKVPRP